LLEEEIMARDPFVAMYKDALDATGLPWSVENGSSHKKIFLSGRLVLVLPNARKNIFANKSHYRKSINSIHTMAAQIKAGGKS
jgi:hypothetical protein